MSRFRFVTSAARTIVAVDTNAILPAAFTDKSGTLTGNLVAGVADVSNCGELVIDITSAGTTAGNFTVELLAWNHVQQAWMFHGELTIAGMDTLPTPRPNNRAVVTNWCGNYAFALVKAFATGTTAATITITGRAQDT